MVSKHDVVREAFKKNFGAIAWNEKTGGVSRRLKNINFVDVSRDEVDQFKADLRSKRIDTSLVKIKANGYTTVLYPATWFSELCPICNGD